MEKTSCHEKFKKTYNFLKPIVMICVLIWGFYKVVDFLVEKKLYSTETINRISSRIRPFTIFNINKHILYGAVTYDKLISSISIDVDEEKYPVKIIIETKKHVTHPPLLECLDADVSIKPRRGESNKWIYDMRLNAMGYNEEIGYSMEYVLNNLRFRLYFIN